MALLYNYLIQDGQICVYSITCFQPLSFMNASTLATLPTRNKNHFLSSFIQQQQHFLQQYINEGQRVARSWDVSKSVSPPASPKNNPQLGFGTPVLRARLDLVSTRIDCPINKDHGQTGGGQECLKKNERQLAHNVKSQHDLKSKERQKKNISRTDKKRSKENSLLSDSEHETVQRQLATPISAYFFIHIPRF